MGLNFPGLWRFTPPHNGHYTNSSIPQEAVHEFVEMIDKIAGQGNRWSLLEHFKSAFGYSARSSNESWAGSDLARAMERESENAPLFIEAFWNGCEALRSNDENWYAPDAGHINSVLAKHSIGYELQPPNLLLRELGGSPILVANVPPTLAETAKSTIERSLLRSEQLLNEGHPREGVQEILWLLETVATAFRGLETQSGRIEGKYFNQIVRDLRNKHSNTTLERILDWITNMHGYLSSPKGGGVRHGIDLAEGSPLSPNEARLFCNLTRTYIHFLLTEHRTISKE
jgi:hypothetical protein